MCVDVDRLGVKKMERKSGENEKFVHKTEMHFNSTFAPKWLEFLKAFSHEEKEKNGSETD